MSATTFVPQSIYATQAGLVGANAAGLCRLLTAEEVKVLAGLAAGDSPTFAGLNLSGHLSVNGGSTMPMIQTLDTGSFSAAPGQGAFRITARSPHGQAVEIDPRGTDGTGLIVGLGRIVTPSTLRIRNFNNTADAPIVASQFNSNNLTASNYNLGLGQNVSNVAFTATALGWSAAAPHTNSIAIGTSAATSQAGQLSIGSAQNVTQMRFGDGTANVSIVNPITASGTLQADGQILLGPSDTSFIDSTGTNLRLGVNNSARLTVDTSAITINDAGLLLRWGSTSAFPALKRNGTAINFRLADDSADAPIACGAITASGNLLINVPSQGTLTFRTANTFISERSNSGELMLSGGGSTSAQRVVIGAAGNINANDSVSVISGSSLTRYEPARIWKNGTYQIASQGTDADVTAFGNMHLQMNQWAGSDYVFDLLATSKRFRFRTDHANGVAFRNVADTADAPISCGAITASGAIQADGQILLGPSDTSFIDSTGTNIRLGVNNSTRVTVDPSAITINDSALLLRWGTTSAFPALKRSGTTLQARLGDDSGDANITASQITLSGFGVNAGNGATGLRFSDGFEGDSVRIISRFSAISNGIRQVRLEQNTSLAWAAIEGTASTDVILRRDATGPSLLARVNGGLRVRNFANDADAPIACGTITSTGTVSAGTVSGFPSNLGGNNVVGGFVTGNSSGFAFPQAAEMIPTTGGTIPTVADGSIGFGRSSIRWGSIFSIQGQLLSNLASRCPLIVRGAASQAANLTEWQNSAGTVVASVSPFGWINADAYVTTSTKPIRGQNGNVLLASTAGGTTFNLLQFGGVFADNPALKRDGTTIRARLADDSADSPFSCSNLTTSGNLTAGTNAIASGIDSVAFSGRATGYRAVAFPTAAAGYFASGQYSFMASSHYSNASGSQSVVLCGDFTNATANRAFSHGSNPGFGGQVNASQDGFCVGGAGSAAVQATFGCGFTAYAHLYGQKVFASGRFAAHGDAQKSILIARNRTTNDVETTLFLDGLGARLVIPNGKVFSFIANVTGISSDGTHVAYYVRKGVIKRVANTTSLVGTIESIGTDHEDNVLTDVVITADDTNKALQINVVGIAGETWRWVAVIEGTEIAFGV